MIKKNEEKILLHNSEIEITKDNFSIAFSEKIWKDLSIEDKKQVVKWQLKSQFDLFQFDSEFINQFNVSDEITVPSFKVVDIDSTLQEDKRNKSNYYIFDKKNNEVTISLQSLKNNSGLQVLSNIAKTFEYCVNFDISKDSSKINLETPTCNNSIEEEPDYYIYYNTNAEICARFQSSFALNKVAKKINDSIGLTSEEYDFIQETQNFYTSIEEDFKDAFDINAQNRLTHAMQNIIKYYPVREEFFEEYDIALDNYESILEDELTVNSLKNTSSEDSLSSDDVMEN